MNKNTKILATALGVLVVVGLVVLAVSYANGSLFKGQAGSKIMMVKTDPILKTVPSTGNDCVAVSKVYNENLSASQQARFVKVVLAHCGDLNVTPISTSNKKISKIKIGVNLVNGVKLTNIGLMKNGSLIPVGTQNGLIMKPADLLGNGSLQLIEFSYNKTISISANDSYVLVGDFINTATNEYVAPADFGTLLSFDSFGLDTFDSTNTLRTELSSISYLEM